MCYHVGSGEFESECTVLLKQQELDWRLRLPVSPVSYCILHILFDIIIMVFW